MLQAHGERLMGISGVVGTGEGRTDGEPCIRVFVTERSAEILLQIPSQIEGYEVDVVETGEFRAR